MSEEIDARQLIEDLRGTPCKCDFCGKETQSEKLEPEEGGEWVCHDCMDRWESNRKKQMHLKKVVGK